MSKPTKYLTDSANGMRIMYDPNNSHTATHFRDNNSLESITKEALSKIVLSEDVIGIDIDMQKSIGLSDVVEVDSNDEVYYAMRTLREDQGYVQFTSSKERQSCNFLSIWLEKRDEHMYELMSCWIGRFDSPLFPQMEGAIPESIEFWSKHAFVEGSQQIIEGSKRTKCPW